MIRVFTVRVQEILRLHHVFHGVKLKGNALALLHSVISLVDQLFDVVEVCQDKHLYNHFHLKQSINILQLPFNPSYSNGNGYDGFRAQSSSQKCKNYLLRI